MEKLYDFYQRNRDYILFAILLILVTVSELLLFYYFENSLKETNNKIKEKPQVTEKVVTEDFVVDIKGEVKKPGVYALKKGKRVIDVVRKAGGFTKKADTSANNFSMKIKDEMVIVVYSKNEIENYLKVKERESEVKEMCKSDINQNDTCIKNDSETTTGTNNDSSDTNTSIDTNSNNNDTSNNSTNEQQKLISINTATKEELMTLPGIGEAKALSILEYRKTNKFEKIEDIKNVSGIGDALFEKIKNYITT